MTGGVHSPDQWEAKHVAALRTARCETLEELAEALGVAAGTVWMWEKGRRPPGRQSAIRSLETLFRALNPEERRRYGRALARIEEAQSAGTVISQETPGGAPSADASLLDGRPASHSPPAAQETIDMHRRDANKRLASLAATAAVTSVGSALGVWTQTHAAERAPVTPRLVADREDIMRAYATAYASGDAQDLLPGVSGFAGGLAPLLALAPDEALGLRLASLLVEAHGMAGVLANNVGDTAATARHLGEATRVAEYSRDPLLRARAWSLGALHLISPRTCDGGSSHHAAAQLGRAKALARRHADGYTRAFLLVAFAHESADLGEVGLCLANLDEATHALDTATGHDGGFFSPDARYAAVSYLRAVYGRALGLAGRVYEAERTLGESLTIARSSRERANNLCYLATVRIENGEPEGACAALGAALDNAHAQGCPGLTTRIRAVRGRMLPAMEPLGCVRDLDERLRTVA